MILIPVELTRVLREALAALQAEGQLPAFELPALDVRPSKRAGQGDYSTALMGLAKPARMNPAQIAALVAERVAKPGYVAKVEAVAPGYLNFWLDEAWLRARTDAIIAEGEALGELTEGHGKRAQVEFVSANPTAPLHIGRSRGAIVGDTMARLLEAAGYDVEREYYFNNAGAQMRALGNSLRIRYLEALGLPYEMTDEERKTFYQGDYLKDFAAQLAAEVGDSWQDKGYESFKLYAEVKMFEMIKATLA